MGLNERWSSGLTLLDGSPVDRARAHTRGEQHAKTTGLSRVRPSSAPVRRGKTMGPAPPAPPRDSEWLYKSGAQVDRARHWADVDKVSFREFRYDDGE